MSPDLTSYGVPEHVEFGDDVDVVEMAIEVVDRGIPVTLQLEVMDW